MRKPAPEFTASASHSYNAHPSNDTTVGASYIGGTRPFGGVPFQIMATGLDLKADRKLQNALIEGIRTLKSGGFNRDLSNIPMHSPFPVFRDAEGKLVLEVCNTTNGTPRHIKLNYQEHGTPAAAVYHDTLAPGR